MKTLSIIKTGNEIEDICITNGLASLLEMNDIGFTITQLKTKYKIEADFEIDELEYLDIEFEDCRLINSTLSKRDIESQLKNMNDYFNNNFENVLKYYFTLDEKYIKKDKSMGCIQAGTGYYTLSIRASTNKKTQKTKEYKRHLAFLGFIKSVSYIKNDNIEINSILIPKQTNEILRPYVFGKEDDETGEFKVWTSMKKLSDIELISRVYLETHRQYSYLKRDYEKIIYMTFIPAGNKPLFGKTFELNIKPWSSDLCYSLNFDLFSRNSSYDTKDTLARYISDDRYVNFNNLIKTYAIDNKLIDYKYKEEFVNMYNDKIKEIYNNESVNKLARAFNRLSYDGVGFEIQSKLNSVANTFHLQDALVQLGDTYKRNYNYCAIVDEEFKEVLSLIDNKKDAKIVANAILAGKVFVKFNKKNKDDENTKEVK